MPEFDAIILADTPLASVRIAGLQVRERALRVARRVGAARVCVIYPPQSSGGSVGGPGGSCDRAALAEWHNGRSCAVVVIRADQLVHTGLIEPLIESLASDGIAMAVAPESPLVEDVAPGGYAGAFVATGTAVHAVVAALAAGASDSELVQQAAPVPHGRVARAPVATQAQRRAAHRVLYSILVKPQDNAITRYLFRPVSFPLTRFLVWTPITPNQVSYVVAALVVLGCWLTARASFGDVLAGTIIVLAASYIDCCDGEIARLKLLSSRYGAWLDTIVDELSSVGYMVAIGWHCHMRYGNPEWWERLVNRPHGVATFDPWQIAIFIAVIAYAWSIYCVYYNIIVAVGSANSQDYVARFELAPGGSAGAVRLVPRIDLPQHSLERPRGNSRWLQGIATLAPYVVRRDFIVWATVLLVAMQWTRVCFIGLALGGIATSIVVTIDHLKLRALQRAVARRGQTIESPHAATQR